MLLQNHNDATMLNSKKFLTSFMEHELQFKKIKVSQKGQIVIPADIQRRMGIKKGDELLLISKGKKIVLEKPDRILAQLKDEFKDVEAFSEHSLKKIWFNKKDDVWDQYMAEQPSGIV
jgi:AbrB family looped-hinge helix DNA binding protein